VVCLGAKRVLEIEFISLLRTCAKHFAAKFLHESRARKFFVQSQSGKRFHAEGQERFADVKAGKFFAFEDDHAPAGAREEGGSGAAGRPSTDDGDIVHVGFPSGTDPTGKSVLLPATD